MIVLLDTHTLLWFIKGIQNITPQTLELIAEP
jgi:PIN domain nuclease of toxin-antitoxin system